MVFFCKILKENAKMSSQNDFVSLTIADDKIPHTWRIINYLSEH